MHDFLFAQKIWFDAISKIDLILLLFINCHFGILLLEFESELALVVNIKVDHFDIILPTMQKVQKVWFRVWLPLVLKVSLMIQKSKMTICKMLIFLFSLFDLATFSKFVLGLWMCFHTLHKGNKAKTSLHAPTY